MTEGGADKGAWHQQGGNVWVCQRWRRQRQLVAEINNNKGSSSLGECPYLLIYKFVL
jgi:hypothetical protein